MQGLYQNKRQRCKVYTKIEGKEKFLAPKLDNLWKHGKRRKALITIPRVCNVGEYLMNKCFVHAKNERWYVVTRNDIVLKQTCHATFGERTRYWCNFLFVSTCYLKVGKLWWIMKLWAYCYISLMLRTFQKPINQT
jgi:hypothetical protein